MTKLELNNAINTLRKELHDNCMNGGNYNYWEEVDNYWRGGTTRIIIPKNCKQGAIK